MNCESVAELICKQNYLKSTDGSSHYSQGDTAILVGVYGPVDCKESEQDVKQAVVEVNFRPKIGIPGVAEKYVETFIKSICETVILRSLNPRALFSVIVQIMQDRGSLLCCAVNGVSMALQDAGISLKFVPVAVAVAVVNNQEKNADKQNCKLIFNPTTDQETLASSVVTFVFDSIDFNLISTLSNGALTCQQYDRCLKEAKQESKKTLQFFRASVAKKLSSEFE